MGLVDPWSCAGQEILFLKTFINLLDNFCTSCQTNERIKDSSCKNCPAGILILKCKEEIIDYNSFKKLEEMCKEELYYEKTMRKIKREIKKINPIPLFNVKWIFDEGVTDILERLRFHLKELKHFKHQLYHPFMKRTELEWDKKIVIINSILNDN